MTDFAIILCEGAHDQAAIAGLISQLGTWEQDKAVPRSLPSDIERWFPKPRSDKYHAPVFERPPSYFRSVAGWVVVRNLGGIDNVLGSAATSLLDELEPRAVGLVIDADTDIASHVAGVRSRFSPLYPHAANVDAGTISDGEPRFGLWIAPDNSSPGNMSDLLLAAATTAKPKLTKVGVRFADSINKLEPGKWYNQRTKAVLGAVGQSAEPGASLAVALNSQRWIFTDAASSTHPLSSFLAFLKDITHW